MIKDKFFDNTTIVTAVKVMIYINNKELEHIVLLFFLDLNVFDATVFFNQSDFTNWVCLSASVGYYFF